MPLTRVVLNTPNIMCTHCKTSIEGVVGDLFGVKKVEVDVEAKSVALEYDDAAISLETVERAMAEEGYGVVGRHVIEV